MVEHLFADFLRNETAYAQAEQLWIALWEKIDANTRQGWERPWFQPLPPSVSEGNPIFSAISPRMKRGIRILQSEPTESGLELVAYPDTFGGSIFDPDAVHELVISCALSDVVATIAQSLMTRWIQGKGIDFNLYEAGLVASNGAVVQKIYSRWFRPEVDLLGSDDFDDERFSDRSRADAA